MTEQLQTRPEFDFSKEPEWSALIEQALNMPGSLGNTYNRFYRYSFFNQMLLYLQGVNEPVATYKRWQELGRQVQKGSKARTIMRPMFRKATNEAGDEEQRLAGFKYINCLFPVSETSGDDLPPYTPPAWSPERALEALNIKEVPFTELDGNVAGWSYDRTFAINPVAVYPLKTMYHELAHIVIGHSSRANLADYVEHRGTAEFQAEATALLVMNELGATDHMDAAESRAYIQTWMQGEKPDDKAIRQIFGAVDKILSAGRADP